MLSIPLDSPTSTTISELYGNAPYFALLDEATGEFKVIENEKKGNGIKGAEFLSELGVTSTVFYHMGEGLYKIYDKNNVEVFTCKKEPLNLDTIYTKYLKKDFTKLDNKNYKLYVDEVSASCKCGCGSK